jgi:hypothetical protein
MKELLCADRKLAHCHKSMQQNSDSKFKLQGLRRSFARDAEKNLSEIHVNEH